MPEDGTVRMNPGEYTLADVRAMGIRQSLERGHPPLSPPGLLIPTTREPYSDGQNIDPGGIMDQAAKGFL